MVARAAGDLGAVLAHEGTDRGRKAERRLEIGIHRTVENGRDQRPRLTQADPRRLVQTVVDPAKLELLVELQGRRSDRGLAQSLSSFQVDEILTKRLSCRRTA